MAIDERTRHEMYSGLEEKLGSPVADALMAHLPPVGWADVATKQDIAALEAVTRLEIGSIEHDVGSLKQAVASVKDEVASLKQGVASVKDEVASVKQDVSSVKQDVASVKQDLVMVNERLAEIHRLMLWLFSTQLALTGLMIGIAKVT